MCFNFAAPLLVVLVAAGSETGAGGPGTASVGPPVATPIAAEPAVWPPLVPDRGHRLRFRGGDTGSPANGPFASNGLQAGPYSIDGDSTAGVIIHSIVGDRVELESPGEWEGAGMFRDSIYWGVFVYRRDAGEPGHRGARGTHLGRLERSGRLRVRGTFTNRAWPVFENVWTPRVPHGRFATDSTGPGTHRQSITLERLREIPVDDLLQHPLWPPPSGEPPGPRYEHPVWPPEWSKPDTLIVVAGRARRPF
jgi:hypothetical protein